MNHARYDVDTFPSSLVVDIIAQFGSPGLDRGGSWDMSGDDFNAVGPESLGDAPPVVKPGQITSCKMQLVEAKQAMGQNNRKLWCS